MDNVLYHAHRFILYLVVAYLVLLGLFITPYIQRHALFSHAARWPLNANFSDPVQYGLAPYKTYLLNLTTSDGLSIGGWHVLPDPYYHQHTPYPILPRRPLPPHAQAEALAQYPTVVYFHGNAGSRAARMRVSIYMSLSTRLGVNVVAIDYRGFGENVGKPSQEGLTRDARAAWDWLTVEMGVDEGQIVLMGQSLGTGVTSQLANQLQKEGKRPRGIVLVAAFASIPELLTTYTIFHVLPLLKPLTLFPSAAKWYLSFLRDRFESATALQTVEAPLLLIHAQNDADIPFSHSQSLFDSLLSPLLPPSAPTLSAEQQLTLSGPDKARLVEMEEERAAVRSEILSEETVDGFAVIRRFERKGGKGEVVFLNTLYGGHNLVSFHEGAQDVIGRVMGLGVGPNQDQ